MRRSWLAVVAAVGLVVAGVLHASAADKDTLVIALDMLGAQVMEPIAEERPAHAHYHAPIWDSIEGMNYWAVNSRRVGEFKTIPGRHELGDVTERIPLPAERPWG